MIQYLNLFFYDIYPYLCGTVFLVGSWLRYDYGQYTWRASSSQMLDKRGMVLWSNLFHIGILGIFFGHLFGMLTPRWVYSWFLPMSQKQLMAMILGGICGVLTLVGGIGLLMRRLTNPRIRATSTTTDILILCILLIQCALGLTTIPFSAQHPDGSEMLKLVDWAQAVVTFHGGASAHLDGVAWIYRVHLVLGMTIFLIFPFTRLVHVWSAPVEYFTPALPGGTLPALSAGGVYHSSLPVARTRPSRQVRVFIVPGSRLYAGWRLRLIRPTGASHRLIPRRPAQAQRRRARYQTRYL
ncbi:respiratory nitrate reductase subunit gamma [Klebsiella pneumoniae]|nr:respiratory nitrate reductase subunit gamma [Klebsiella pneumoniae]